jgi:hypothetical protein
VRGYDWSEPEEDDQSELPRRARLELDETLQVCICEGSFNCVLGVDDPLQMWQPSPDVVHLFAFCTVSASQEPLGECFRIIGTRYQCYFGWEHFVATHSCFPNQCYLQTSKFQAFDGLPSPGNRECERRGWLGAPKSSSINKGRVCIKQWMDFIRMLASKGGERAINELNLLSLSHSVALRGRWVCAWVGGCSHVTMCGSYL